MKLFVGLLLALATCAGCQKGGAPTPQTAQDEAVGLELTVCVFNAYLKDLSTKTLPKFKGDAIAKCGPEAEFLVSRLAGEALKAAGP